MKNKKSFDSSVKDKVKKADKAMRDLRKNSRGKIWVIS